MKWCGDFWTPDLGGRTEDDISALGYICYNFGPKNALDNQELHGWILYKDAKPVIPEETRHYNEVILGI